MQRSAAAHWSGDIKTGNGHISTDSTVLSETPYSFATRFESGKGTNPEELIAAAHAGCFSMALSMILGQSGMTPTSIDTRATVTLKSSDGGFIISDIHLAVSASVPGADEAGFLAAATTAKEQCPVSKVLNAKITMDATLD